MKVRDPLPFPMNHQMFRVKLDASRHRDVGHHLLLPIDAGATF
jgi:hypothetical protein